MKEKLNYFLRITLTCCMMLSCLSVFAQKKQTIDLKLNQVSFKEFLMTIESKSDYRFVYDGVDINSAPKVSTNYTNAEVKRILDNELPKANIRYEIKGFQVVLMKKAQTTSTSGSLTTSGQVIDEFGEPTPGASVVVKGTTIGVLADENGKYTITIPAGTQNPTLIYSFVGYINKEEVVGNRNAINVKFSDTVTALADVVVIGYGSVKKSDATGALDVIKSSDFNKGSVTSPEMLLNGHVAGVQITPGSGQPGANTNVRIRGVNSISASSEPLYVIDGVPIDNSRNPASDISKGDTGLSSMTLNPLSMIAASDIESMTVLKDASATAIYGSRGANGVIIITTKSGKDGITSVNYSSSVGISNVTKKMEVLSADQFRKYSKDKTGEASIDWQDEIFRTAVVQDHNITLANGGKNTSYRASLSVSDQQGVILATGVTRYSLRTNVTHKMFDDRLIFNINANNTHYKFNNVLEAQNGGADGGIINNALKADPNQPIYLPDGTFNDFANIKSVRNPVAMAKEISDKTTGNRFIGSADATFFILPKDLSVKVNFGYDTDNSKRKIYQPIVSSIAKNVNGRAILEDNTYSSILFESYLTYNKTFNKIHSLNIIGGYSWQEFESYASLTKGEGFPTDKLGADNIAGASYKEAFNRLEKNRLLSYYGRVNYNLMDKYLFTATVRRDGSSRFGPNKQWGTFPSAAIAWKVKEEDFLKDISFISDLKLRAGFGITGNQDIGNFKYAPTYTVSDKGTILGGSYVSAYSPASITNPDLKWEQTAQFNAGIDFSIFKNKIRGSLDVYSKKTSDLLLTIDALQPAVSSTYLANIGAMTNKGIEFTLNAVAIDTKNFGWNVNFNAAYNNNKITELYNDKDIAYGIVSGHGAGGNIQVLRVGEPFGTFYGYKYLGMENGKEVFDPSGLQIIGNALPKYTLGLTNSFNYKNWDLSFILRSSLGAKVYNNTRAEVSQGDRIPGRNTNIEGAELFKAGGAGIEYRSSRWVENASYLRLDNMSLGYNMQNLFNVIKNARIYATAQNLFVITKYKGYDPEVSNQSGSKDVKSLGIDYCSYPHARTFILGLNVNF